MSLVRALDLPKSSATVSCSLLTLSIRRRSCKRYSANSIRQSALPGDELLVWACRPRLGAADWYGSGPAREARPPQRTFGLHPRLADCFLDSSCSRADALLVDLRLALRTHECRFAKLAALVRIVVHQSSLKIDTAMNASPPDKTHWPPEHFCANVSCPLPSWRGQSAGSQGGSGPQDDAGSETLGQNSLRIANRQVRGRKLDAILCGCTIVCGGA